MTTKRPRLLFTPSSIPFLLRAFGKEINEQGKIMDSETGVIEMTPEGEELTRENFGGLKKGSVLFLKKDLLSVIKLVEGKY